MASGQAAWRTSNGSIQPAAQFHFEMTNKTQLFQSKWYHVIMATIYFLAGVVILIKSYSADTVDNTVILGWLLCIYGAYRLVSSWISFRKADKVK